ncbi:MAG: hypothetical protein QXE81_06660 [Desulfurococcaceae archaeon]
MVSRNDLKVVEKYDLLGDMRYRICVKGTNIIVNVSGYSDEEAINKALDILLKAGLNDDSLERIRNMSSSNSKCRDI